MTMGNWALVIGVGVGVLYYMGEREKNAIKISGNRAVTNTVDKAGNAVGRILDEAGPAIGKWLGGLFSGSSSSSSSSSSGGSAGANTTADFYNWSQDGDYV